MRTQGTFGRSQHSQTVLAALSLSSRLAGEHEIPSASGEQVASLCQSFVFLEVRLFWIPRILALDLGPVWFLEFILAFPHNRSYTVHCVCVPHAVPCLVEKRINRMELHCLFPNLSI